MKDNLITDLFGHIARRPEIQATVPMGYTPGIPVLCVRQDNLCVRIPFLRYKVTGKKDQTLVYPIRYVVTYLVPEMQMIEFVDLAFTSIADKVDFNKPVGYFRHKAIIDLDKKGYDDLRKRVLNAIDTLSMAMLGEIDDDEETEHQLANDMGRIVEPSLYPFYRAISPSFYEKYIQHGENKE